MDITNKRQAIEQLIKEIILLSKNTRKKIRENLYKIEELGGYISLGYKSIIDFYEKEFEYSCHYLSRQSTTKDIELLIGVPIGTYDHKNLPFECPKLIFINNKPNSKSHGSLACSLKNAEKIKQKWGKITKQFKTNIPTQKQLLTVIPENKKIANSSGEFYKQKSHKDNTTIEQLKKENKNLKKKITDQDKQQALIESLKEIIENLKAENTKLEKDVISKNIPALTRNYITQLQEENEQLKDKNAKLERELKSFSIRVG